ILVLLLRQHDPDDLIEFLKNDILRCGQKDRQVQAAPFFKTSYLIICGRVPISIRKHNLNKL
ncbi:MAG: hypothetical protein WBD56_04730, partial [Anaerolineales bacterium]